MSNEKLRIKFYPIGDTDLVGIDRAALAFALDELEHCYASHERLPRISGLGFLRGLVQGGDGATLRLASIDAETFLKHWETLANAVSEDQSIPAPAIQEARKALSRILLKAATTAGESPAERDLREIISKTVAQMGALKDAHQKEIEDFRRQLNSANLRVAKAEAEVSAALEERDKAAKAAVKRGVDVHASHFDLLCRRNSIQSWIWVAIVALSAASAIAYIYLSIPAIASTAPLTTPGVIRDIAPRLLIFSIFYLVIVWAARNFGAARHNHTINSHRAAALKSFDAFTSATEGDKELRLAILKQVTTAIFESQATAYLKEPASGNENLIQVFADAVTKKGPDA